MNFIKSLRRLVSKTSDKSKASDWDDDDDSSSSSTRTSSQTQSSSAAITTSGKKTKEDADADEDCDSDEEEKGNSQETEVQHDDGKEEEGSDKDDFAEPVEEEENDPYADIVASLSSLVMGSIRASRIPTDMISTRSARDGDISPEPEEAEEEENGTEEDIRSADTAYDDDVRTAGTVPSQTCLLARKPDDAQITGTQGSQPPAFESPNWKGEPNASRRPPCECLARGRATCTCAFRLSGIINDNVLEEERAATISNPNHHAPDFESPQWHGEPNASRGPKCECFAKGRSTCTCSFML